MLGFVRNLLTVLNVLNWLCIAVFTLIGASALLGGAGLEALVSERFAVADAHAIRLLVAGVMGIAAGVGIAAHFILRRLVAIIDTVAMGRPFSFANADRLRVIAIALLAIQFCDLIFGWLSMQLTDATGEMFGWSPSISGWIAVFLLFVLAEVFRQGARMQDEIEATV